MSSVTISQTAGSSTSPRVRVMVVDGNADLLSTLSCFLELSGFEVMTACTGVEAVTSFQKFDPDAVLMELRIPGLDGFGVCRLMRDFAGKRPMIVAHTGWLTPDIIRIAGEAGFDQYMVKPSDPNVLVAMLGRAAPDFARAQARLRLSIRQDQEPGEGQPGCRNNEHRKG